MKSALEESMKLTGKTKFKTQLWSFGIQKNAPSVIIDAESIDKIPDRFIKYAEPEINKAALKEALNAGEDLKGIAHFEQSQSLRIR